MPEDINQPTNFDYFPTQQPNRDAELTRWQLSAWDLLNDLEHDLKGEFWNENTRLWEKAEYSNQLLNDKGVRAIISLLKPIVNKNTFLSNLREERVNKLLLFISNRVCETLYFNFKEFDIKPEFYFILNEMIQDFLETAFRRPQDEGERSFIRSTEQRRVLVQERPNSEKKGVFGLFKGGSE